jgi:hypothetical protein
VLRVLGPIARYNPDTWDRYDIEFKVFASATSTVILAMMGSVFAFGMPTAGWIFHTVGFGMLLGAVYTTLFAVSTGVVARLDRHTPKATTSSSIESSVSSQGTRELLRLTRRSSWYGDKGYISVPDLTNSITELINSLAVAKDVPSSLQSDAMVNLSRMNKAFEDLNTLSGTVSQIAETRKSLTEVTDQSTLDEVGRQLNAAELDLAAKANVVFDVIEHTRDAIQNQNATLREINNADAAAKARLVASQQALVASRMAASLSSGHLSLSPEDVEDAKTSSEVSNIMAGEYRKALGS